MITLSSKTLLATLAFGAFACSSTVSPITNPLGDGGTSSGGGTVTFSEVYTKVLGPNCSSHHAAGQADSFLDLSSRSSAISSLVGVTASGPACGTSGKVRVVAGSAATSLLFQKVSMTTPPCGSQMPYHLPALSSGDQGLIQSWINNGAKDD